MEIGLVVLGLFVLVWIISAVVKASQDPGSKRQTPAASRSRPADNPRVERTSNTDIDRFMAEIDRLRRRGEGAPVGRASAPSPRSTIEPPPRPAQRSEPRPRPVERERRERDRERERRPRTSPRPVAPPPPLPRTDPVPVLRPVAPEPPTAPGSPPHIPPIPPKPVRPARTTATTGVSAAPQSAVLQSLHSVLQSRQGPAVAVILAEIFGEPPGRRGMVRPPHHPKFG